MFLQNNYGRNIRFVVMNNLLPSTIRYHEKYDLKVSAGLGEDVLYWPPLVGVGKNACRASKSRVRSEALMHSCQNLFSVFSLNFEQAGRGSWGARAHQRRLVGHTLTCCR